MLSSKDQFFFFVVAKRAVTAVTKFLSVYFPYFGPISLKFGIRDVHLNVLGIQEFHENLS